VALTDEQADRAAGVLLGQAAGDALGVPYEFALPPALDDLAEMRGGGLGDFAPGEWSDDTAMAMCIADIVANGYDLLSEEALDAVAANFVLWLADDPADIGLQTSAVLRATRAGLGGSDGPARVMTEAARTYTVDHPHSAGNGALMRTAIVALASLHDRARTARAARQIASLTHADPLAGDSCVLWSEAVRVAVLEGRVDVDAGLDLLPGTRREQWRHWLEEARAAATGELPGGRFNPNGFTVTALQAAYAAILGTPEGGPATLQNALHAAVRIGNDTDTVAAIAGGLMGARWGASAVPRAWRDAVHGWAPGGTASARELVDLAGRAAAAAA
jgi:ADP-ribosylglycohydrolase